MEIKVLHQVMDWNEDVSEEVKGTLAGHRICMINAFFLVTFYVVIFLSGYTFRSDLAATHTSWTAYLIMPFVALVLDVLAYKAINKDEQLVRSMDRIR